MATKRKDTKEATLAGPAKSKRKRVKVKTGQLVAVPLLDGTFALVHVALYDGRITAAHFAHRKGSPEQLLDGMADAVLDRPIAILAVTSDEVYDGHWPVLGHKEPTYPAAVLDMKGTSYTASVTRHLFEAYYGLRPWDEMAVPRWYDQMLLPGVPVPPTVRYKRDFEKDATAAGAVSPPAPAESADSGEDAEPPITEGPAVIHIEIKYPGEELPTIELLHRRQAIETALEQAGVGEVTDAGGGGGVMDVYLATQDVAHAMPFVTAAVKEAGFEKDTRIETEPLNDGDEDE